MGIEDSNYRASQIIGHIVRHHLNAEEYAEHEKFHFIDSEKFIDLVEKVAHLRESALDYASRATQKRIDSFLSKENPLLGFFRKAWIRFSSFAQHPQNKALRYQTKAEELIKHTNREFFGKLKELPDLIGLFKRAAQEGKTEDVRALLEVEGLDQREVIKALFPSRKRAEHPESLFLTAVSSGKEQVVEAFLQKQSGLDLKKTLQVAIENQRPQIVGILISHAKNRKVAIPFELFQDSFIAIAQGGNYPDALKDVYVLIDFFEKYTGETISSLFFRDALQAVLKGQWPEIGNQGVVIHRILELAAKRCGEECIGSILVDAADVGDGKLVENLLESGILVDNDPVEEKYFQVTGDQYARALVAACRANSLDAVLKLLHSGAINDPAIVPSAIAQAKNLDLSKQIRNVFDLYTHHP